MAGAIRWARFLFHRIKYAILPFLKVPEMLDCEKNKVVSYFKTLYVTINVKLFIH